MNRINYEHFQGIAKPIETSTKLNFLIIDNAEFHYTESKEIQDNTLRNKIITYIDRVEDDWNKLKGIISYIITTVIITIVVTTIIIVITSRKIGRTERRINLIEGFLPTSVQMNVIQARKGGYKGRAEFRRHSSFTIDPVQQKTSLVIDRMMNG